MVTKKTLTHAHSRPAQGSIKALLFDLDGTLIESKDAIFDSVNMAIEERGFAPLTDDDFKGLIGKSLSDSFRLRTNVDLDLMMERYRQIYMDIYLKTTYIYPGVIEMLQTLQDKGVRMGVVTLKRTDEAQRVLEAMDLEQFFPYVIGSGGPYQIKPSYEQVKYAVEQLEVEPGEVMVIGDSEIDLRSGRGAGCATVLVTWGHPLLRPLTCEGPDWMIASTEELESVLETVL